MNRRRTLRWIIIVCILCVLIFLGGLVRSYYWPQENHVTLNSNKVNRALHFLVLSDLHEHAFGKENEELLSAVRGMDLDAIFILGDMLNGDSKSSDSLMDLICSLTAIKPVYYAMGNHEYSYMENTGEDLFAKIAEAGAVVLEKTYVDLIINHQPVRIGGLYDYAFAMDDTNSTNPEKMDPGVYEFLTAFEESDAYKIMLSHRPDSFILGDASKTWEIDLVVSGHLHGGQVVLPIFGGLYAGEQGWFPQYVHGLYEKDLLHILITSGLGSQRRALPRWNNPPELMVIELTP